MKGARIGRFIRAGSAVYMAAVIEYLLAGNCARDNKRKSIKPRHIMMAVEMDDELKPLFGGANVILPGGGVVPGIHSCLTNKVDQNTFRGWSRQNLSKAGCYWGQIEGTQFAGKVDRPNLVKPFLVVNFSVI